VKVIIDLNVVLDVLQNRAPHYRSSAEVLSLARAKAIEAIIPSHAVTTIYYVVAKSGGKSKADFAVDWLLANFRIAPAGSSEFQQARQLSLPDFEDAVVACLAVTTGAQYIVSRNESDFHGSPVPVIAPSELVRLTGNLKPTV
jgi:predicted nucleic acid-binding protein